MLLLLLPLLLLLQGYKKAGQYQTALANIKWVTDYFIKCIGDGNTIVAQVCA
jgi:hypothetical protein